MDTITEKIADIGLDTASEGRKLVAFKCGHDTIERKFPEWDQEDPYEPCGLCGWTPFKHHYWTEYFKGGVKALAGSSDRVTWALGNSFVLKERGHEEPRNEVVNAKFLKENTTIPTPAVIKSWTEGNRDFIMSERVGDGAQGLDKVFHSLSLEQKTSLAKEVAECLTQLRGLTSEKMQTVDGRGVSMQREMSFGPSSSEDEFLDALIACDPHYTNMPTEVKKTFRKHMLPSQPFTFTHMDLAIVNIMVRDGKLAAIIDWEFGAYLPVWWEFGKMHMGETEEDEEFAQLVSEHLPEKDRYWKAVVWRLAWFHNCDSIRENDPAVCEEWLQKLLRADEHFEKGGRLFDILSG